VEAQRPAHDIKPENQTVLTDSGKTAEEWTKELVNQVHPQPVASDSKPFSPDTPLAPKSRSEPLTPEELKRGLIAHGFDPFKYTAVEGTDGSIVVYPLIGAQPVQPLSPASPISAGTGFFITVDGYLVTNAHVVEDGARIQLRTQNGLMTARIIKIDVANDLALLKAEGLFSVLPVISSRSARLGSTVATVGFPNIELQGFAPKLTKGEISSLTGIQDDPRYFQISAPVQPGNSGGALVDDRGNVVGVVAAKLDATTALAASGALPENVNYAVKSSFLLSFLESVPEVAAKMKDPRTKEEKFEDVVKSAEQAAVLVLVY
jgi:S1-C subfamily serine protease